MKSYRRVVKLYKGKSIIFVCKSRNCNVMKRLLIKNFGPIKEANFTLGQVNVIIGMQSSGKNCSPFEIQL